MTNATPTPEASLAELQSRLQDLELSKTHNDATAIITKERTEMLIALRAILSAMKSEASGSAGKGGNANANGGGASSKELEQLRAENEELKKVNAKQAYRIQHLVHNLREALEKNEKV